LDSEKEEKLWILKDQIEKKKKNPKKLLQSLSHSQRAPRQHPNKLSNLDRNLDADTPTHKCKAGVAV
jgi:hypothetical protein